MEHLLARVPDYVLWDREGGLANWFERRGYPRPLLVDVVAERTHRREARS